MSRETLTWQAKVVTLGRMTLTFPEAMPLDARIAAVAEAQHGVISARQVVACGLSPSAVRARATRGRLHRLHRGVFAPGHRRLPALGGIAAAVLACGPEASAAHRTSARLRGLRSDGRSLIDVAVRSATGRRSDNVVTHSSRRFRPQDINVVEGIPATSVARTLLDCAPGLGRRGTEKMVIVADRIGVFDLAAVRDLLAHVPGHNGVPVLRAAVGDAATAHGATASPPEDALLVELRRAGLPEPECNAPVQLADGAFVFADFLWRGARLVVEADPLTHDNRVSYRSDRRRDRALDRIGLETMRFSDEDLADPASCAAEVRQRHDFRLQDERKS